MNRQVHAREIGAFREAPDPRLFFASPTHSTALGRLTRAGNSPGAVTLLTGAPGTGKTLLLRVLAQSRPAGSTLILGQNGADMTQPLRWVLDAAGLDAASASEPDLLTRARAVLTPARAAEPQLLIVDEAQRLDDHDLDQMARLAHPADGDGIAPAIILAGLPNLTGRIASSAAAGLRARIVQRVTLSPLTASDTRNYVAARLAACRLGTLLSLEAVELVHRVSGGVPRRINQIIQQALFEAMLEGRDLVDAPFLDRCLATPFGAGMARTLAPAPPSPGATGATSAHPPPGSPRIADQPEGAEPAFPRPEAGKPNGDQDDRNPDDRGQTAALRFDAARPSPAPPARSWGRGRWAALALLGTAAAVTVLRAPATQPIVAASVLAAPPAISQPPDPRLLVEQAIANELTSPARAALLYESAALWGDRRAAYFAGQLYETGLGVPRDLRRARAWYRAAGDMAGAERRLQQLAVPADLPSDPGRARPLEQRLYPDAALEIHWQGDAPIFAVEYVRAGEPGPAQRLQTSLTAVLLDGPVSRWRILSLREDGGEAAATGWSRATPGGR